MTIDASIPLKAQVPNFFGTIVGADQAAAQQNEALHQKGLRNFLRDNGAAVYAGDDAALGQLAQYDPQQALGIRSTRDEMAARQERLRLARAAGARAAEQLRLSREEKAKYKAEYNQLQSLWLTGKDNPEILAQGINALGLHQIGVTPETFIDYLSTAEGAAGKLFGKIQEATPEPATNGCPSFQASRAASSRRMWVETNSGLLLLSPPNLLKAALTRATSSRGLNGLVT